MRLSFFLLLSLWLSPVAFGQEEYPEYPPSRMKVYDLNQKIEKGDAAAVFELMEVDDKTVIAHLQKFVPRSSFRIGTIPGNAQMALAKLGETRQWSQILTELESKDPDIEHEVFKKLAYIGDGRAMRKLFGFLDDMDCRTMQSFNPEWNLDGRFYSDRVIVLPRSVLAAEELAKVVMNPATLPGKYVYETDIPKWRAWLAKHPEVLAEGYGMSRPYTSKYRIRDLIAQIEKGDLDAILELGRTGDRAVIPYLKKLLPPPAYEFGSVAANAQMALAKRGDKEEFGRIVWELQDDDPLVQDNAVKKLVYIGGKRAIQALLPLIDETKPRKSAGKAVAPLALPVLKALAHLVPNPPVSPDREIPENRVGEFVEVWKKWLAEHPQ